MICEYDNEICKNESQYALYRLYINGTKVWLNLCDKHEKAVFVENNKIKRQYPELKYKEINNV